MRQSEATCLISFLMHTTGCSVGLRPVFPPWSDQNTNYRATQQHKTSRTARLRYQARNLFDATETNMSSTCSNVARHLRGLHHDDKLAVLSPDLTTCWKCRVRHVRRHFSARSAMSYLCAAVQGNDSLPFEFISCLASHCLLPITAYLDHASSYLDSC